MLNLPIEHPILERDRETATVETMLERTSLGAGGALIFEGAAGVGKTVLLELARREALDRGFRVLEARAGERESEYSWGVVRSLFEPFWHSPDEADRALLDSPSAEACRSLFRDEGAPPGTGPDSSFAVFTALFSLVRGVASADHPLLIAIDDLHWVDGPSLGFIEFVTRRVADLPVLIATTLRSGEAGSQAGVVEAILTDRHARRLVPGPLSRAGSEQALRARLGDEIGGRIAQDSHAATGGNPLLLNELARAIEASGSEGLDPSELPALASRAVSRTVEVRLERAGEEGRALAAAAAVLGEEAQLAHAVQLSGLDPAAANRASIELARLEVLAPGSRVHFIHPIIRAAIYDRIGAVARAGMHKRAAEILAAAGAPPERLAGHLLEVAPDGDQTTVATLREAAVRAASGGDSHTAMVLMRRALAEPPAERDLTDCLSQLGAAEILVDGPASVEHLSAALERIDAPPYRAAIAELLARSLIFQERVPDAIAICEEVLAELRNLGDRRLARRMEAVLVETTMVEPRREDASYREEVSRLLAEADQAPGEDYGSQALLALSAISGSRDLRLTADEVIDRCRRAAESGVLVREGMNGIAQLAPAQGLMMAGRCAESIAILEEGMRWDERYGSMMGHLANRIFRGRARLYAGDLEGALSDAREAMPLSRAYGIVPGVAWSAAVECAALLDIGETEAAVEGMDAVIPFDEPAPDGWHWMNFMTIRARVRLARGDSEGALAEARRAGEVYARHDGVAPTWLVWRLTAAEALANLGEHDAAVALLEEELGVAERWGAGRQIGSTLRTLACVQRDPDLRLELLERAVGILEPTEARMDLATALVDLGAEVRRRNRKAACREALKRGMNLAHECGAKALAERARTELRASGVRPRRTSLNGPESLTESERRVVELARAGLTNREIAGKLYVTVKTVEVHLSSCYRKLGIKGRRELPVVFPDTPDAEAEAAPSV